METCLVFAGQSLRARPLFPVLFVCGGGFYKRLRGWPARLVRCCFIFNVTFNISLTRLQVKFHHSVKYTGLPTVDNKEVDFDILHIVAKSDEES